MSRIVDIEPLLKKYDGMNEGTEFSPIHFINDLMALEQQPSEDCISREHAKQFLYYEIEHLHDDSLYDCFARIIDDMYNELPSVIPQIQPCEDCISREAVIRLVEQYPNIIGNRCSGLIADIKHLPSVTPKYTDEEIDKAQAVEQAYVDKMVELAVEETKVVNPYKYCPNCGAEMSGGKEDEASD